MGIRFDGFQTFTGDTKSTVSYASISNYYLSKGLGVEDIEEVSYPQEILWKFSDDVIISTHRIGGIDPLVFRNVYHGVFDYNQSGFLKSAVFNRVSFVYHDPEDSSEYGFTYQSNSGVVWEDTNSLSSWDVAINKLTNRANMIDEYELGTKQGILNGVDGNFLSGDWRTDPFASFQLEDSIVGLNIEGVYRLFNSATGNHMFSSNPTEIDIVTGQGWANEGIAYKKPGLNGTDLHRFLVKSENRHFYTANENEKNSIIDNTALQDYQYEGVAFSVYAAADAPDGSLPVIRYLNTLSNSHLYSSSTAEQDVLNASQEWVNEGLAWYGESF